MKAQFFGHLDARHLEAEWWQMLSPLGFYSAKFDLTLCTPARFVLDFASVPRLPGTYLLAGNTGHWEAAIHDLPYRFGFLPRLTADYIFYEAGRVRSRMRSNQTRLYRAGRLVRTLGMSAVVLALGWTSYKDKGGCLDHRVKCAEACRIDTTKCKNYYHNWRQCVLPGYRPDILALHGS